MKYAQVTKKLEVSLQEAIEGWIEAVCENDEWVDCFVGPDLAKLMTESALNVLKGQVDLHNHLIQEGLLKGY